jgi:hypothetical protein
MEYSEAILEFIKANSQATAPELARQLEIPPSSLFRELAELIANGRLVKVGKAPASSYMLAESPQAATSVLPEGPRQLSPSVEAPKEYKMGIFICKRLGLDPIIVQAKHDSLHQYLLGGYSYKAGRTTSKIPNLFSRSIACLCELVIWILALVAAVFTQQLKFKEETLANPAQANAWIWLVMMVFILGVAAGSLGYDQWLRHQNSSLRQQNLKEEIETLKKNQERLEKNVQRFQDKAGEFRHELSQCKQQLEQPKLNP